MTLPWRTATAFSVEMIGGSARCSMRIARVASSPIVRRTKVAPQHRDHAVLARRAGLQLAAAAGDVDIPGVVAGRDDPPVAQVPGNRPCRDAAARSSHR
ncbi:hypothetical protein [Actinomadura nitritigenes]|uniref:hypothetical protein n=1 Tax=Actinomadura nitritigenes TaxID=134602 RepID=UPI003D8D5F4E